MKIKYLDKRFRADSLVRIVQCNEIITRYAGQGLDLTLRQLYYQLVSQNVIPNSEKSYDNLGALVNDARLAGLLDWDAIEDRTRHCRINSSWKNPAAILDTTAYSYHEDLWADQPTRVEVWIEKDALVGVLDAVCPELDVPYFSCRGYASASEMWRAGIRMAKRYQDTKQLTHVLHLGDHDPSGIDMSRDIEERLALFTRHHGCPAPEVERIALTMDQVEAFNPPPNPAKVTDARYASYQAAYGDESWELDALPPDVLITLIRENVLRNMDEDAMDTAKEKQEENRTLLTKCSENWDEVTEYLEGM